MSLQTYLLDEASFLEAFSPPMRELGVDAPAIVDIWRYVDAVPPSDLKGLKPVEVSKVYEDGQGRFHQVLIATDAADVFLVIVISLSSSLITGHHLLNLREKYGLS